MKLTLDLIAELTLPETILGGARIYINGKEIKTGKQLEEALKKLEVKEDGSKEKETKYER